MPRKPAEVISVAEFAAKCGVSRQLVYTWIRDARIRFRREAGRYVIPVNAKRPGWIRDCRPKDAIAQ